MIKGLFFSYSFEMKLKKKRKINIFEMLFYFFVEVEIWCIFWFIYRLYIGIYIIKIMDLIFGF